MELPEKWELAAWRCGGVVQFHQLLAAGVTRYRLRQLLAAGRLLHLEHGIYALPGASDLWLQQVRAAVLRAGPDAVVWRRSAGRWWGLDGVDMDTSVEVAVGHGGRGGGGGGGSARIRERSSMEVTTERGVVVTTVAQTLVDLGRVCDADLVERALEDGLRRRAVDLADLAARADRSSRGWSGRPVLRHVLDRRPAGAPPTGSDAETLFLQLVRRNGFPEPERQIPVFVDGRLVRLDFGWRRSWRAVEIDGAATHAGEALGRDLRRQNAVLQGTWTLRRFTWEDVVRFPDYVLHVMREWWS